MTLHDIVLIANDHLPMFYIIIVVLLSLIEVSKIKINPWSWIGSIIFKGIIDELKENKREIVELKKDFYAFKKEQYFNEATASRRRILRFNDEAVFGVRHTREHFDEIIADIDNYECFCKENQDYQNNKGKLAMKNIKEIYQKRISDNTFS